METQPNEVKTTKKNNVSNTIAWIFIALQCCLLWGGIYNIMHDRKLFLPSLVANSIAIASNITKGRDNFLPELTLGLVFSNLLCLGALLLGSGILSRNHNKTAKITVITALIVIGINSVLYIEGMT